MQHKVLILPVLLALFVFLSACSVIKHTKSVSEQVNSNDYKEDMISVEAAKRALEDGNAELLLIGGISPTIVIGQEKFKKKYGID